MAISQSGHVLPNGQAFLSIGNAAAYLGCSVQALRQWEADGLITAYRTCGGVGQRRYRLSELEEQVLGVKPESYAGKRIAVYVRVSHTSQKAHLKGQRERLIKEVCKREKVKEGDLLIFEEIASSFGNRPALNKMIDRVLENQVSKIYAEHHDRLSRVASLTRLVEHLTKKHSVEIVALDREVSVDDMQQNMAELVEFVHVISCRTIARRVAERRRKKLHPETVAFIKKNLSEGRGIKDTTRIANLAGHRTVDGVRLSYRVVHNYSKALEITVAKGDDVNHTFRRFAEEKLEKKKGSQCQAAAIYEAYVRWCEVQKTSPLSKRKCGDWLRANKYKAQVKCGYGWYLNVNLRGYANVINGKGNYAKQ